MATELNEEGKWYDGVTRYQWLVLIIASLGWMFDIFEGQIFVASMNEAMKSLAKGTPKETIANYNQITLGMFLLGGALGGVLFGMMSDRVGRKKTMSATILMYSLFTCLSAFSQEWWHMAVFRFLVAMGVGGEWAVASAMVAEEFPRRARARASGIFHASSIFGTWLAIAAATFFIGNESIQSMAKQLGYESLPWRLGFGMGVLPALLIIWIRRSLREPESWQQARKQAGDDTSRQLGRIPELFKGELLRRTLVGVTLAAVGLATFWGAHIFGKDLLRRDAELSRLKSALTAAQREETLENTAALIGTLDAESPSEKTGQEQKENALQVLRHLEEFLQTNQQPAEYSEREWRQLRGVLKDRQTSKYTKEFFEERNDTIIELFDVHLASIKRWEMLGMFLVTTGGGLGLLFFGPLCERVGRRKAFLLFHLGAVVIALITFQYVHGVSLLIVVLPVFGFLTLGMHAGYAIYFPELFPTRLRGTGGGFCFNFGRIIAAPILIVSGLLREVPGKGLFGWGFGMTLEDAASLLCLLFLLGAVILAFAPETKGEELPE